MSQSEILTSRPHIKAFYNWYLVIVKSLKQLLSEYASPQLGNAASLKAYSYI
jgi:hypothetical protein